MIDPYPYFDDIAKSLLVLYQNTQSDQALSMYNRLEKVYLEPYRRKQIAIHSAQYAQLTQNLQAGIKGIDADVQRINNIDDNVKKVAEYAGIFDQIMAAAAGLLKAA